MFVGGVCLLVVFVGGGVFVGWCVFVGGVCL